ncbi:MAG: bifunctional adenosylcobinamide kinase/adenosylcobinamide-phosphate guanylyltransferase, partial [Oscillospiraceae bacterium]
FHLLVKRFLESTVSESEIEALVLKRFQSGNCICVIADEIGCGVVPLEKFDRQFRECTGRILCALAKKAETVVQLQCGIPILLKGTLK